MKRNNDFYKLMLKNIIRDKYFKYLSITLVFCFLIIFISLSFYDSFNKYVFDNYNNNLGFRMINFYNNDVINKNDIEEIKKLDHVDDVISSKYYSIFVQTSFKNDYYDGYINLISIPDNFDNYFDTDSKDFNYKFICPKNFLPDLSASSFDFTKKNIELIDINKSINKNIDLFYSSFDSNSISKDSYFITGSYDNKILMNNANDCYVSKDIIKKIVDNVNLDDDNIIYSNFLVVDNSNNVTEVMKLLHNRGYSSELLNEFDFSFINIIRNICIILTIVSLSFSSIMIILFFKKRILVNSCDIGILRFLGLKKNDLYKYLLVETFILLLFFIIICFILFVIIRIIFLNNYSMVLDIYNMRFLLNYHSLIIIFITSVIIPLVFIYFFLTKLLKKIFI